MIYDYVVKQDGQTYEPGEEVPDMGGLICTSFEGKARHYKGANDDRAYLPTYVGEGSTFTASDTGYKYIFNAQKKLWYRADNSELSQIQQLKDLYSLSDEEIQKSVKYTLTDIARFGSAEIAKKYFPVGTVYDSKWTDTAANTVYDYPWIVVHYGEVEDENGEKRTGMFLQSKYIHPISPLMPLDVTYSFAKSVPAGKYYVRFANSSNKTLFYATFTFYVQIPQGAYLCVDTQNWEVQVYTKDGEWLFDIAGNYNEEDEPSGTYLCDEQYSDYSPHKNYYDYYTSWGSNVLYNYLNSDMRDGKWLAPSSRMLNNCGYHINYNSSGTYSENRFADGFLCGLPNELKELAGSIKVAGKIYSPTLKRWFDNSVICKAFIPSITEIYGDPTGISGEADGEPFDYYKNISGVTDPMAVNDGTAHESLIAYAPDSTSYDGKTAMQQALRTPGADSNDGAYISESGAICTGQIVNTFRPVICILL